jgi:tetratricopeptide (TPR) repeat protein
MNLFSNCKLFKIKFLLFIILLSGLTSVYAQSTSVDQHSSTRLFQAMDFYQRGAYEMAVPFFLDIYLSEFADEKQPFSSDARNCMFYLYDCLLRLDKAQVTTVATAFIESEDPVIRKNLLSFQLAAYYFRRGDYKNAMEYDARAGMEGLSNEQIGISKFRKAYALFNAKRYEEARPLLSVIAQMPDHPHYEDAHYYSGFIAYEEKDYPDALKSFVLIRDNAKYRLKVPYYLTALYYNTGLIDMAIEEGELALKKSDIEFKDEIRKLLGHIFYDRREYNRALLQLEAYISTQTKVGRDVYFELHDTYYRLKKYDKAIEGMKQLSGGSDKLSQFALYILADAYLQTGQKENARNAFYVAANNNSDALQKEVSVYMYAKLSAELGFYGEATGMLKRFIGDYPKSSYLKEAKELLTGLLASSNNYKDALVLIREIDSPSQVIQKLIPLLKFGRATELLNDQQYQEAEKLLDDIMLLPYNEQVLPLANYWKGELVYKKGMFTAAINYYQFFIKSGHKGQGEATISAAYYNLGYCYLKLSNYAAALQQLEKVQAGNIKQNASAFEQDAIVRRADCYFMLKQYAMASRIYQNVIDYGWSNADYATFQKAIISGITSPASKIDLLRSMELDFPLSSLLGDASMEIAKTLMAEERFREAIPCLIAVARNDADHPNYLQALLLMGIAWYNLDEYEKALTQFKSILAVAPYAEVADEAIDNIRSIYLETGQPEKYEEQMRDLGRAVTVSQADSLAYAAVELKLTANDCKGVIQTADQYLKRFQEGQHFLEALLNRSECYMALKDIKSAIKGYEVICSKANNPYVEKSALILARIYFFDEKNYTAALPYYELLQQYALSDENKLEAHRGKLRCSYQLRQYEKGASAAKELLFVKLASTDDKALSYLMIGRYEQQQMLYDNAISAFNQTKTLNKAVWGAEAGFAIAQCYFEQKQFDLAEKNAFEVIKKSGSYTWWVTKSYILLGDIFTAQKDYFNAKATYQSVADHATDDNLKKEAMHKLTKVKEEELRGSNIIEE